MSKGAPSLRTEPKVLAPEKGFGPPSRGPVPGQIGPRRRVTVRGGPGVLVPAALLEVGLRGAGSGGPRPLAERVAVPLLRPALVLHSEGSTEPMFIL